MKLKRMGLPKPENKILLPTNSIWDIITGKIISGARGEKIIVGGATDFNAYVGPGNSFKSAVLYYSMGAAANYIGATAPVLMMVNDTECNTETERINHLMRRFEYLNDEVCDPDDGELELTNKALISGDMWWKSVRDYGSDHVKTPKITWSAFLDKDNKPLKTLPAILIAVDSFSKLGAQVTDDMLEKSKGEDSSTNTVFMKDGLFKTKLLGELPTLSAKSNMYFFTTAHTGRVIEMGNIYNRPPKKLSSMKDTMDIKKVSAEFFYLTKLLTNTKGVSKLNNSDNSGVLYPTKNGSNLKGDLKAVMLETMRNKHGASEAEVLFVISQKDGVLPELTDYHLCRINKFGISGSPSSYYFEICPDIKFTNKTIRDMLEASPKLARAARLTADLFLLGIYHNVYEAFGIMRTPRDLHTEIIEAGYEWDDLLNTRGWYTPDNYTKDLVPYMSIVDLLEFNKGKRTPYWHKKKKSKDK